MKKLTLMLTCTSLVVMSLAACDGSKANKLNDYSTASDQPKAEPAHLDDILLKREVTTALQRDPLFGNGDIIVSSLQGQITLEGSVDSNAAITRAAEISRKVKGVTFVTNKLVIKATETKS
ncbi:hypothetical protein GCM10010919_02960 [Alishewanella longhuensis]|uniref:BON domain-containing protein n=1 Tax=Alishewanella longhuensis TaxID=1091037 RepID=A0ABQ3KY71_9ALTE|nr:BON domain-containing protein [Alishewanella longhuensis]GHG59962.1 hypothetical protein GCM10010919_02960 [Alishewanella longhuensis]